MLRKFVKDYLTFSRRDRIGLLCLIGLIGIVYFLPKFFFKESQPFSIKEDSLIVRSLDTLQMTEKKNSYRNNDDVNNISSYQYEPSQTNGFKKGELFQFDPNTSSEDDWKRLGLNARTTKTILKYTSKGGKFYKPEDLKKIWGMPEEFYERVKDYITITSIPQKHYDETSFTKPTVEKQEKKIVTVNINEADTSAFIALPGIGSKLAARIVNFREKLGGFYSVEQIGETYGLPDSTFQKLKLRFIVSGDVKKININTATKDELKVHPYIKWNLANAIVEYRNQHGNFKSLDDLKSISVIDDATFKKIVNYLGL